MTPLGDADKERLGVALDKMKAEWSEPQLCPNCKALQAKCAELEQELVEAKKRIPARSSGPIGAPVQINPTNVEFWFDETDEEFEGWGKEYTEVTE